MPLKRFIKKINRLRQMSEIKGDDGRVRRFERENMVRWMPFDELATGTRVMLAAARFTTLASTVSTRLDTCSARSRRVSAVAINSGLATLAEIDETTASTLRFGDDQVATFVTSFNAADVAAYRMVGTRLPPRRPRVRVCGRARVRSHD